MGFLFTHLAHMKSYDIWTFSICFVVSVVIWRFMLIKIWHPQLWWCSIQMMQLRFAILTNHVFRWLLVVPHLSITKVRKKCYIQLMVCTMEISKFSWTFHHLGILLSNCMHTCILFILASFLISKRIQLFKLEQCCLFLILWRDEDYQSEKWVCDKWLQAQTDSSFRFQK